MPEPLKAMYNEPFLRAFVHIIKKAYSVFDGEGFIRLAPGPGWNDLELKGRTRRHYPGMHRLTLVVNGQEIALVDVILQGELASDKETTEGGLGS